MNKTWYFCFLAVFVVGLVLASGCTLNDLKKAINPKAADSQVCPVECATEKTPSELCSAECIPVWEDEQVIVIGDDEKPVVEEKPTTDKPTEEKPVVEEKPTEEKPVDKETSNMPTVELLEGEKASLANFKAVSPDGYKLVYTYSKPFNDNGDWQTKVGDAGKYVITLTVDDGKIKSTQKVLVNVKAINKAPTIKNFEDITVTEGEVVSLKPTVSDPEGDSITTKITGWMTTSSYTTTYDDAGSYDVTLTASDGKLEAKKSIKVTVKNKNRAPILDKIQGIAAIEGDSLMLVPTYSDADKGDKISLSFSEPFNENGKWQTSIGDAGTYNIDVVVSDSEISTKQTVLVIVNPKNHPPVIEISKEIKINEGEKVVLSPKVSDIEGDSTTIKYSGWMTTSSYTTNYNDAGVHIVKVTASDGKADTSVDVKITVENVDRGICWCFGTITPECKDFCTAK